jgi:hypothetical protein
LVQINFVNYFINYYLKMQFDYLFKNFEILNSDFIYLMEINFVNYYSENYFNYSFKNFAKVNSDLINLLKKN